MKHPEGGIAPSGSIASGVFMKFRYIFIILLLAGAVGGSFYASEPLYRFYLQFWYREVKSVTPADMEKKALSLYDTKEYEALSRYLDRMTIVYSQDKRVLKTAGIYFIRMKQRMKGAELLAAALDGNDISGKDLREAIQVLFEEKYYGDIEAILRKKSPFTDPDLQYYYGISLLKTGNFRGAVLSLKKAYRAGYHDAETLHFLSRALVQHGNLEEAERYLEIAHAKDPLNHAVTSSLADVYRKRGKLKEAAAVMVRRRR